MKNYVQKSKKCLHSILLQYVEKYKKDGSLTYINESDKAELITYIAPLVYMKDTDEYAKRFDNFMYGLMLSCIEQMSSFKYAKQELCKTATALEGKHTIPQVMAKMTEIKQINSDEYWAANDILLFEQTRKDLRDLIKFLVDDHPGKPVIETFITDPVIDKQEGNILEAAYDFEDYKKKVNRYIEEHGDAKVIEKLKKNRPLTEGDFEELERILTVELGTKEDYHREFGDTPFGLLVRKIAKLDHAAAMEAFSTFINDESLNQRQIAFVNKIINHIEQNGYMENVADLLKPPFDKPVSFVKLFDMQKRTALLHAIQTVTDNATRPVS